MFIRTMLQSDWLILELGPSIHFRIDGLDHLYGFRSKLTHRILGKMVDPGEIIDRGREMLVTFGKLFRKFSGKTRNGRLLHF